MHPNATTLLLTSLAFIFPLAQGCLIIGGTLEQEISCWWLDTQIWDNGGARGMTCTSGFSAWVQLRLKAPNPVIGQFAYAYPGQKFLNRIEEHPGLSKNEYIWQALNYC